MKLRGLSLLRTGKIEIVLDYSWVVIFFVLMYTVAEGFFPQMHINLTKSQYWTAGAVIALLYFFSVLAHELAHCYVSLKYGIKVKSIRLLFFGGLSEVSSEPKSGRHEFLIALAGPAMSMFLGFAFLSLGALFVQSGRQHHIAGIVMLLGFLNIALAIFNLIPGFPLDGGRILKAILWDRWNDSSRATKVVSQLGNGFAFFIILLGIALFVLLIATWGMILGLWLVFIGLFMKQSAMGSYQAVMLRRALSGVKVRQIMTENVVTVDWLLSVDELVRDYIYKHQFTNFPVFNRDDFVGMVSLEGVKSIPKDLWAFKQVRDIMVPVELVHCLKPTEDATEAWAKMASNDTGRMPVIENDKLVGIVTRRDIMNLFKIKSDLDAA
jgi:Zn-dependent protease/predicted transcriptional regulator